MEVVEEQERIITVNIYDAHASNANFKVKQSTTAADICKIILSKRDILASESRFFSIVLIITAFNSLKKTDTHCLRTLKPSESLLDIQRSIVAKMVSKHGIASESKLENADRWYFKDMRTNPIDLGATAEICGEYDSDEDKEISQSDLSYLAKSERKGYLLKRSNTDFNLWRRWYCVLMDQLWCVDMSRESPRAKCVKLSGMIRYREGYKTLDQLQIIIINSSDSKSHFFRAFNLIDQKKWIQDLNIKTRVAADNDCFSMAEMMMTNEEDAKNFRIAQQLGDVLDQVKTMEALAFRRAVELNVQNSVDVPADTSTGIVAEKLDTGPVDNHADSGLHLDSSDQLVDTESSVATESVPTAEEASISTDSAAAEVNVPAAPSTPAVRPNINDIISPTPEQRQVEEPAPVSLAGRNVSLTECTSFMHPRCCSRLNLDHLSICDRVEGHYLVHELHRDSRIVTEIMLFVIDVHKYKETLRRELYIKIPKQQQTAKDVYLKHILPQLQMANLDAYPDFSHEMMQLGGIPLGQGWSSSASSKVMPSSPSRLLTSLSSKSAFSPTAATNSNASASGKYGLRNEYASRVRNRSNTTQSATTVSTASVASTTIAMADSATSAFAAINWALDVEVLMRVHKALFEIHTRGVELQNGYVTQDPLLLVKYAAGSSKFRTKDRTMSTASNAPAPLALQLPTQQAPAPQQPSPTPSNSFWPWWGSSSSAASNGNSQNNSAATSPVPTSRKNTMDTSSSTVTGGSEFGGSDGIAAVSAAPPVSKDVVVPRAVTGGVASVVDSNGAEDKANKPPPGELFDEVVAALIHKLS